MEIGAFMNCFIYNRNTIIALVIITLWGICGQALAYDDVDLEKARKYYEEKSYQLSAQSFAEFLEAKAQRSELEREVLFKWSDSIIKSKDENHNEKAQKNLISLIEGKEQDRWWAESAVSLSALYTEQDPYGKHAEIKLWLDNARNWWAGSTDIEQARKKFIDISFQLADFVTTRWGWYTNEIRPVRLGEKIAIMPPEPQPQQGNDGLQVLYEEILKVATTQDDKARAHYGLAMARLSDYTADPKRREKAFEEFNALIENFPASEWTDDAYYQMGTNYEGQNDYVKALEVYNKYLEHYKPGESQWLDDVSRRVEYITAPSLAVSTNMTFIPGSQVQLSLNWRNLNKVNFKLYTVDLTQVLDDVSSNTSISSYYDIMRILTQDTQSYTNLPIYLEWQTELEDEGKHIPHGQTKGLAQWRTPKDQDKPNNELGTLAPGAYILMVQSGEMKAFDLVLISDASLLSKVTKDRALFIASHAKTGEPLSNANISFIYSYYDTNGATIWEKGKGTTDSNGVLSAPLKYPLQGQVYNQQHNLFASLSADESKQQAFIQNNYYNNYYNSKGEWWLYAFSDRPAYRPNEKIGFKGVLRKSDKGQFIYTSGMPIKVSILNPQGQAIKDEILTLNEYGSFSGQLELDEKALLGQYSVQVYSQDGSMSLANAQLFRLEEYKLPEFTVNVKPLEKQVKQGEIAAYRLGDSLEIEVDAKYYFGGAVSEADVEYLVYMQPYYHQVWPVRPYEWFYQDMYPQNYNYGYEGQLMKQEKIKTDKDGKAKFTIQTPKDSQTDLSYRVEVRVVDSSRREIIGSSEIKVTKNAFFANLEPKQSLYRPGDKVQIAIKTTTANDQPVSTEGKVSVNRNWWHEPVINNGQIINPEGYEGQELFTKFAKTNDKGEAIFEFEPSENGYYVIKFTGYDNGNEVTGEIGIYVCEPSATNIGYRYSGLQIITEKDTYSVGETARALIITDKPDTWVFFSQESDDLYGYQMLHMEGSVKSVEIPINQNFTPNIFFNALSTDNYQLKQNSVQIIVPPEDKFLNVKITSDKAVYQPQEEGVFDIEVTDKLGKPVSAEIALGLTDASVYYIQSELADDIRKFYYGDKKLMSLQTQTSFYQRPYVNLIFGEDGNLLSQDQYDYLKKNKSSKDDSLAPATSPSSIVGGEMGMRDKEFRREVAPMEADGGMMAPKKSEMVASMEEKVAYSADSIMASAKQTPGANNEMNGSRADGLAEVTIRNDFRSTVIWQPSIITDESGKVQVKVKFPDSLTTWKMTARALTKDTAVGTITHEVRSNKELMVRLQEPRFFTERDQTVVSAVIDNISDTSLTVMPEIKVQGLVVSGLYSNGEFVKGQPAAIQIPAKAQARVDWVISANQPGEATITIAARSDKLADAMTKTFKVIPHGIEKFEVATAVIKAQEQESIKEMHINIPKERIKESSSLEITLSPSLAANLMDALPYLADYPYGCVEQTMSRFLPAIIVRNTMVELGLSKENVDSYIRDVLEPRNDPKGNPMVREDATYTKLDDMLEQGLKRLYDFQHTDGGWGWWKDGDSDRYMSAYVIWGLSLSKQSGVEIKEDVLAKGVSFLQTSLIEEENNPDMLAWMLHALAQAGATSKFEEKQAERLWNMRDKLNPYTRALFALSEFKRGNKQHSDILARNLIDGMMEDKDNETLHWGEAGVNYHWSEGGVESTAFVIKALSQLDPQNANITKAVKWMALNRRGARWKNTRDTAIAILGLSDYLKATQELAPEYTYQVFVNDTLVREGKLDSNNIFNFGRRIMIPSDQIKDGDNKVKILINGKGAMYASVYGRYFTLEEPITKAGNEIFVTRDYEILSVKETLMKGMAQDWKPLNDNDKVKSGDRIRVNVTIEAKNNYEYILSEDYKPAGAEAVEINSGSSWAVKLDRDGRATNEQIYLYQEFRDQKAAFFIPSLNQGKYRLSYELRAEVPGKFHAMPNQAHAMYVPEIRTNSDESRLEIMDKENNQKHDEKAQ